MWTVLAVIVVAGLAGGLVNYTLSRPDRWETKGLMWSIIPGVGAAFLVPLFLQAMSSDLLAKLFEHGQNANQAGFADKLLVFAGFCLLAAISSKRFIETLTEKVMSDLRDAKKDAAKAKETADRVEREEMRTRATEDSQRFKLVREEAPPAAFVAGPAALPEIAPGNVPDDPWAGQFGGRAVANNRRLEARIRPHPDQPDWCLIRLRVLSTDAKNAPLRGDVQFYLHTTFDNYKPIVPAVDGIAELTIAAWGAFTVGAIADGGNTLLELDLQKHPEAPEPFRSR